ncbi:hypothetical protein D3C87_1932500 [compost metagenome]
MTFKREITADSTSFGSAMIGCITPSRRTLTDKPSSVGRKCTSEAPTSTAWARILLTSSMIGPSSSPLTTSSTGRAATVLASERISAACLTNSSADLGS